MGIGAATALTIGLLAAGCSQDGDTIVTGGNGSNLPGNNDQSPFAGFTSNNLAPDGGAFSENGVNVTAYRAVFNCDCPDSDGASNGDKSAIVLFTTNDTTVAARTHLFASYFDGTFTPPVELQGDDRDDSVGINLNSYVLVPLNTSNYQSGSTSTTNSTTINQVRTNSGNWVIMGDYTTQFQTPNLDVVGGQALTTNNRGARRTFASWVFLKDLRAKALESSSKVGGVSQPFRYGFQNIGTIVPTSFQGGYVSRTNVPTNPGTLAAAMDVPACHVTSFGAITDGFCGETTFGGQALPFSSRVGAGAGAQSLTEGTHVVQTNGANNNNALATGFTHAVPMIAVPAAGSTTNDFIPDGNGQSTAAGASKLVALNTAQFRPGEDVSHLVAVWTQVCSSISGGGSVTNPQDTHGGHELQLRFKTFNLATLSWENDEAEVAFADEINARTGTLRAGTAPFPTFKTYNNNLFFKYADASLITNTTGITDTNELALAVHQTGSQDWVQRDTGGHNGGNLLPNTGNVRAFWREVIGMVRFKDDGDGTASLDGTSLDVSSDAQTRASVGVHSKTGITVIDNTSFTSAGDTYPATGREMSNFNSSDFKSILGPDEGMEDISLFYVSADNTNTTASVNIDREIMVSVLKKDGTLGATSFQSGTNPARISGGGEKDYHQGNSITANTPNFSTLEDPVLIRNNGTNFPENGLGGHSMNVVNYNASGNGPVWFELQLNRTGEHAFILFTKDTGVSSFTGSGTGFTQDLHATVYQTHRPLTSTTGATGTVQNPANVETRVPAKPIVLNGKLAITQATLSNGALGAETQRANNAEKARSWGGLPVNHYRLQERLGYRTGFQSNRFKVNVLYEQSDSTEDHVFMSQLTITKGTGNPLSAPTIAATTATEVDATASVQSHRNLIDVADSTFNFVDSSSEIWRNFHFVDAGATATAGTADCLVVWTKIVDNTNTDGDQAEQTIFGALFSGTLGTAFVIDTKANENTAPFAQDTSVNYTTGVFPTLNSISTSDSATLSLYGGISRVHTGTTVHSLVAVPNNTDITNQPDYPNSSNKADVYIYFGGVEVVVTTATTGGAQTIIGNGTQRTALYTRKYDGSDNTKNTSLDTRLVPTVAAATFAQPTQVDHEQGIADDTAAPTVGQNGSTVGLVFQVNSQLWWQRTTNGVDYITNGQGLSNPLLITNFLSTNVLDFQVRTCLNSAGDVDAALLMFRKPDEDNDQRLFVGKGQVQ
ncbi:MAG: hypothetical protein AB7N76_32360 [Planctomycetota bacterium]